MSAPLVLFGWHAVSARLRRHAGSVHVVYVDHHRQDTRVREVIALATSAHIELQAVEAARLDALSSGGHHAARSRRRATGCSAIGQLISADTTPSAIEIHHMAS